MGKQVGNLFQGSLGPAGSVWPRPQHHPALRNETLTLTRQVPPSFGCLHKDSYVGLKFTTL